MVFHWKQCKEWGGQVGETLLRNSGFPWGWNRRCVHLGQVCIKLWHHCSPKFWSRYLLFSVIIVLRWSLYADGISVLVFIMCVFSFSLVKKSYNSHFLWFSFETVELWRWAKLWIRNSELQIVLWGWIAGSIVFRYSTMTFQHSILGSVCPCVHLCHAFQFLIVAVFLFPVCSSSLGTYCFPSFILLIVNSGSTHTALLNVHTLPFALHFVMFISHSLFPMTEGT